MIYVGEGAYSRGWMKGSGRDVRYSRGALNRLKWLVHVLMLQWLWSWVALISRLSDAYSA